MHLAHVHDPIEGLAAAPVVAGVLADPAGGGGQRIVHDDGLEGIFKPAFLVKLKEARDVHAQRATVFARRESEFLADTGAAAMSHDVVFILLAEVADGGEYRIGGGLPEAAERALADHPAQFIEEGHVIGDSAAIRDGIEYAERLVEPDPAWDAFAAGLGVGELDEVAGHVDHAVVFVHDDHAAGAHDGANLREAFIVHGSVEHVDGNATARRPARLHRFDVAAGSGAFSNVVDEALERRAQGHFNQAGVLNLPDKRKDLGAGALGASGFTKPACAAADDGGNVAPGLDVVDVCRLGPVGRGRV